MKTDNQNVDVKSIELVWLTYFKVAQILDLKEVPVTSDPKHPHVKAALYLYSIESFIYKRINKISREKDISSVLTLGPFAVVLTRIIKQSQQNRVERLRGPLKVYRGMSLPEATLEQWENKGIVSLDGYSSTTQKEHIAKQFATIEEYTIPILLEITLKNETGKHYFSLDTKDYSNYPDEQEILL